jgi:hypothetical protein
MRTRCRVVAPSIFAIAVVVTGCKKESSRPDSQLPAATDWSAPQPGEAAAASGPEHPGPGGGDPHAGLDMGGGDPHAGLDMGGGDPHAGVDMGGGDPHAGLDMGEGAEDPAMAAIEPPDPARKIDASKFLRGKLVATAETSKLIKPGAIVFLSVRPIEPTSGDIIGAPLAVDRIDVTSLPLEFVLDETKAMSAGTGFDGDVLIVARVDGDGEARTKEPGDIEGQVKARIPAKGLTLSLDTVLR